MTVRHRTAALVVGTLLTLGAATAVLVPTLGSAQQPAPDSQKPARERPLPGRHIEGRIAFLRTELKITQAQQPHWDRVAAAMRERSQRMSELAQQMRADRDRPKTAVDRLEMRARFAEAGANDAKVFAAAFRPLYDSLSDDQKKTADELFGSRGGRRGFRRH